MFFTSSLDVSAGFTKVSDADFDVLLQNKVFFEGSDIVNNTIHIDEEVGSVSVYDGSVSSYPYLFSGYLTVPVTLRFKSRGYYYGKYNFSFSYMFEVRNFEDTTVDVAYRFGVPTVSGTDDSIDVVPGFSYPNGDLKTFSLKTLGVTRLGVGENVSLTINGLYADTQSFSSGLYTERTFYLRVPFYFASSLSSTFALWKHKFDFTVTSHDAPTNALYFDSESHGVASDLEDLNRRIQEGIDDNQAYIGGRVDSASQQAHEDAQQAHEDAERAHEDSKNIFDKISDFFGGFFDNLINAVIGLFVPSDDDLSAFMDDMKTFLTDKLGFLGYPFEILGRLVSLVAKEGDAKLTLPGFKIMGHVVWNDIDFDLSALMSNFVGLTEAIKVGTSVLIVGAFLLYCQKKFNEVLGGASE